MRVSHHVKRSVCLLHSLLLLAQGMTLGAAAVGTDSVPGGDIRSGARRIPRQ